MSVAPTNPRQADRSSAQQQFLSEFQQMIQSRNAQSGAVQTALGGAPVGQFHKIPAIKSSLSRGGPAGLGHAGVIPTDQYMKGDEFRIFRGKDPAYIARIQAQLITAGLLDPQHGKPGQWTIASAAAMEAIMGHGNWTGQTWHGALAEMVQAGEVAGYGDEEFDPGFMREPFTPQTRLDPDPKVARQAVKDMITQIVGEQYITPELVDKYTSSLLSDYHRQFNQQDRFAREQHEAGQDIAESQYNYSVQEGELVGEGDLDITKSATAIDPEANLRTELERRFKPVKKGIREHGLAQEKAPSLYNSLNSLINIGSSTEDVQEL